ncbi:hypothetical protein UFOVP1083_23 [uncultured Caudovirales phage]|uniref:Uncharacterized protein n=1 Tax=uncultured Caudovirales phage TaxID=2100421 RepID=A0A6J5RZI9_9CAUD|nr:hypothetical protein UFOVP1083_23 [uncultured Caudovirales phage]CAB4199301.1 hypothetical protein UFOVP1327_30 [uncultured Caudovirales phage]
MPSTTDYYNTLKLQLETQATNKKAALDLAYERATSVKFDAQGNMTRQTDATGKEKGPGTLDIQYAEQQRQMSGGAESSGMLKSGQYGRDLATTQAAYRTAVVQGAADTEAQKTAISDETASELAKYQAMYGTTDATTGGGTGGGTPFTPSTPKDTVITAPPKFDPNSGKLVKVPNAPRTDASGSSGMGATQKPSVVVKKPPAVVKKPVPTKVPVPNKIKTLRPGL